MHITLAYGRDGLDVALPELNIAGVLSLRPAPPLFDPKAAVRAALAAPIQAAPLARAARGKKTACIVICDLTRPVPNAVLLPPVLDALAQGGIARKEVTILIATGTHRPNTPSEIELLVGPEIARSVRVANHFCGDKPQHQYFGITANGVSVWLDRTYTDADVKVTIGLIEPHFMAGYSGGRKLVMPGIAALETVQAWHSPRFLEHERATNGVTEGNPVHEENTLIARLCPPDLILDVTLDEEKRITGVFAGDLVAAWEAGVQFVEKHVRAVLPSPHPVDIVVTTGAGWPLDATFYQAVKGMVGALPIVRHGGTIIIAARCSEGVGGADFQRLLRETTDLQTLVAAMARPDWQPVPDQWQVEELAKAVRHHRVVLVSDPFPNAIADRLFVGLAPSVEEAVADALTYHGSDARIAVIPKGPYVIPALPSTPDARAGTETA